MLVFPFPQASCFSTEGSYPRGFAIICYKCLDTWAVCHREGEDYFQINVEACPKCAYEEGWKQPTKWRTPGSVLESLMRGLGQDRFLDSEEYIHEVLDSLPPDVVRSEFNTAIKAFLFNGEPSYLL